MSTKRPLLLPPIPQVSWLVLLVLALGYGQWSRSEYCRYCGLRKHTEATAFAGVALQKDDSFQTSLYTKMYNETASQPHIHVWRAHGRGWTQGVFDILGGGIACGNSPKVVRGSFDTKLTQLKGRSPEDIRQGLKTWQTKDGQLKN